MALYTYAPTLAPLMRSIQSAAPEVQRLTILADGSVVVVTSRALDEVRLSALDDVMVDYQRLP